MHISSVYDFDFTDIIAYKSQMNDSKGGETHIFACWPYIDRWNVEKHLLCLAFTTQLILPFT